MSLAVLQDFTQSCGRPGLAERTFHVWTDVFVRLGLADAPTTPVTLLSKRVRMLGASFPVSLFALVSTLTERQSTRRFSSESTTVGLNLGEVKER